MNEREIIKKLHKENTDFPNERMARNQTNSLELLSSDIFTEYIRFLFELIQNADDSNATKVVINIQPKHLSISHNGKEFDVNDVEAICDVGGGTKVSDNTKTGYKGIGFKSVFGKSKNVGIFSKGFQFRFSDQYRHPEFSETKMPWQIIPVWAEKEDFPHEIFDIESQGVMNVTTIIELTSTKSLINDLMELLNKGEVLLFLRSVNEISVIGNVRLAISKESNGDESAYNEVTIKKNGTVLSEWITKTYGQVSIEDSVREAFEKVDKLPAKFKNAQYVEISFAAKLEKEKIAMLSGAESLIYTYLPTKATSFQFPFIINSSFLANASREELHEDSEWNQWLMKIAAEKTLDWLAELAMTTQYYTQILKLIPIPRNLAKKLSVSYFNSLSSYAKIKEFVPNRNGHLIKAGDVLIDKMLFSEASFISNTAVTEFINKRSGRNFSVNSLINSEIEKKDALNSLDAYFFELHDLNSFFTSETFLKHHKPEQNFALICFFHDKVLKENHSDLNQQLKEIAFLYTESGELRSPQSVCFPSIDYENETGESMAMIHPFVYKEIEQNSKVRDWLESLGVKEPSDIAYIENQIIANIEHCITIENYLRITRFIFNQSKKGKLTDLHYRKLHLLNLSLTTNEFSQAKDCYLSDIYEPCFKLEEINKNGKYVSATYKQKNDLISEWKTFLLKIGVSENISINHDRTCKNDRGQTIPAKYFNDMYLVAKDQATKENYHPHLVKDTNEISLDKISFTEYAFDYKFSKLYWNQILKNISPGKIPTKAHFCWGYFGSSWDVENYIQWSFKHQAIFPTTTKECLKAENVFANSEEIIEIAGNYLPVFDSEIIMSDDWLKYIPFKVKFKVEDLLTILEKICNEVEENPDTKKANRKQIGLVYNKLSSKEFIYDQSRKEMIKDWAQFNHLLCNDGTLGFPNELAWIKNPNFNLNPKQFKTILIPGNCRVDDNFEEFLKLINVGIIDNFIAKRESEENDSLLLNRLKAVLSYLSRLIAKKEGSDFETTSENLGKILTEVRCYRCSKISLTFIFKGKEEERSSVNAYLEGKNLYYTGRYNSPLTLLAIVPEIIKLLKIEGFNEELNFLLRASMDEIKEFLKQRGIDSSTVPEDIANESQLLSIEQTNIEDPSLEADQLSEISSILREKNISPKQLKNLIDNYDSAESEDGIGYSSSIHLSQKEKNEENRIARELVFNRLSSEGFEFTKGKGENSVVNGVMKDGIEHPLVVKSYQNTSYKFNIRPNEWLQLSKPNATFWVHRGNGELEYLTLKGLLRANSDFHIQFRTSTFSFDGLAKFAEAFRFVKNVHFQLDTPNFSIAKALDDYCFNSRNLDITETGGDDDTLLQ